MKKINSDTLVDGIFEYIDSYIVPNIEDNFLKIVLKAFVVSAEQKADVYKKIVIEYLKNSFIQEIFEVEEDGTFDIELLIDSLQTAIKECGDFRFVFPPIKFVSPEEKVLVFKAQDLSDFKNVLINISNKEVK